MIRLVVMALAVAACSSTPERPSKQVPATYRVVAGTPGHASHVGKVECGACHGEAGFDKPPADLCERCHATVMTPLHHWQAWPRCQDCHGFGKGAVLNTTSACMSCHVRDQGRHRSVSAHSDQNCSDCHHPHSIPTLEPIPCTQCHGDAQTRHAGLRGCFDCHQTHEAEFAADQRCVRCHATLSGARRVDLHAVTSGHAKCTGCHQPHHFAKTEARPCAACHADVAVFAAAKHSACSSCHAPHSGTPRQCTSCHTATRVQHATGDCKLCHPPHLRPFAASSETAVACATCHAAKRHGDAPCLGCHRAHGPSPKVAAATCATCHAEHGRTTAGTGHGNCATCHTAHGGKPQVTCAGCHAGYATAVAATGHASCASCHPNAMHSPKTAEPVCSSCHPAESRSASPGHARCDSCHRPHDPKAKIPACTSCHADKSNTAHSRAGAGCQTCHRAHGPNGPVKPPPCITCHDTEKLPSLHRVLQHRAPCTSCHATHETAPRSYRATCLACHRDHEHHEPAAATCAGCHPFRVER